MLQPKPAAEVVTKNGSTEKMVTTKNQELCQNTANSAGKESKKM